jgi:hypothetical protein
MRRPRRDERSNIMNIYDEHLAALGLDYPEVVAEVNELRQAIRDACSTDSARSSLVARLADLHTPVTADDVRAVGTHLAVAGVLRFVGHNGYEVEGRARDDIVAALDRRESAAWLSVRHEMEAALRERVEQAGATLARSYKVLGARPDQSRLHELGRDASDAWADYVEACDVIDHVDGVLPMVDGEVGNVPLSASQMMRPGRADVPQTWHKARWVDLNQVDVETIDVLAQCRDPKTMAACNFRLTLNSEAAARAHVEQVLVEREANRSQLERIQREREAAEHKPTFAEKAWDDFIARSTGTKSS